MKTACIYHSIDLDGWMSAAIVKHWWLENSTKGAVTGGIFNEKDILVDVIKEDSIFFIGYNYGQPIPDLSEYDKVIMCDISFPKEEMDKFELKKLVWIDHHISAIKDSESYPYNDAFGVRNVQFAACELTWKYFMSGPIEKFGEVEEQEPMPEIVRLLGRYDCFGHKNTDEEQKVLEFQYGARQCISNYEEAYSYLLKSLEGVIQYDYIGQYTIEDKIHEKGISIYQYLCTEAKQAYNNGFEIELIGGKDNTVAHTEKRFICINKERFNPINFGIDYHKDGYDGCACFHYDDITKLWRFSLYNDNGEVDCSQIAKQYGGGGHKDAAGFVINDLTLIFK